MKEFVEKAVSIFSESITAYHLHDNVDQPIQNPYKENSIEYKLYLKNWIDTVQWHLEDIIRNPQIDPIEALVIKRRIDRSNQERTDLVEQIDDYFLELFKNVPLCQGATLNTETPAWAIDRLSILELKIAHMKEETLRVYVAEEHIKKCTAKLQVLTEQHVDLTEAIAEFLSELSEGKKRMKVYRQMKMYNDPSTNPVLYGKNK